MNKFGTDAREYCTAIDYFIDFANRTGKVELLCRWDLYAAVFRMAGDETVVCKVYCHRA